MCGINDSFNFTRSLLLQTSAERNVTSLLGRSPFFINCLILFCLYLIIFGRSTSINLQSLETRKGYEVNPAPIFTKTGLDDMSINDFNFSKKGLGRCGLGFGGWSVGTHIAVNIGEMSEVIGAAEGNHKNGCRPPGNSIDEFDVSLIQPDTPLS